VHLRLLGSAAGGGLPQWNCGCAQCREVRIPAGTMSRRLHASLAFSSDGADWYLVGATPDVAHQIAGTESLHPRSGIRGSPIRGVFLSSAELDQVLGLLILREGIPLNVYATAAVETALEGAFPVRRVLSAYTDHRWIELKPDEPVLLEDGRLEVAPIPLGRKAPRYVGEVVDGHWVVGFSITDHKRSATVVYAPQVDAWTDEFDRQVSNANISFVDGTFWSSNEMERTGAGRGTASAMGHLPIEGQDGSARRLAAAGRGRKVYVHVNNTNPILDPRSSQSESLRALDLEVGAEGMAVEL
jgi:pyrroloquinoline quinone biosynthesis protein B